MPAAPPRIPTPPLAPGQASLASSRRGARRASFQPDPGRAIRSLALRLAVAALPAGAAAQDSREPAAATTLPEVVVSASRDEQAAFDAPAAIQSVERGAIEAAGPQVNLSESLGRIPGVTARNRQNYAQDLQISIRGFGTRSTFGIRGIRLLVDGIPATMPDGQGQASTVSLGSTTRIEVLRGPLAQLYGNAAGGVIQAFSADGAAPPTAEASVAAGSDGLRRYGLGLNGRWQSTGLVVEHADFRTDGYRDHSEARRRHFNAKLALDATPDTRVTIVANRFDQPLARDPGGLTRAMAEENPRQVAPIVALQDARKAVTQNQAGVVAEHRLDGDRSITARVYAGTRDLDNALSIPLAAQAAPTSSGGIVDLDRTYGGAGLQYAQRIGTARGPVRIVAGIDHDRMSERRRGFVNDGGRRGELKRDEDDTVYSTDLFGQASWDLGESWTVIGGVRASSVRFRVRDDFVRPGNPDDSGSRSFSAVNPVAGVVWHVNDRSNLYVQAGRGFETPTFSELAYRPGGASGLNFGLAASRSNHLEVGGKFQLAATQRLDVAVFGIRTHDEIVVDSSSGGRTTYRNAGGTSRKGAELAWRAAFGGAWTASAAYTWLDATFRDGFGSGSNMVAPGNRLPGVPARQLFADVGWMPDARSGPFAGAELTRIGRVQVDDRNSDSAAGATVVNLRGGWRVDLAPWSLTLFGRIDNLDDRRYFGSVIVNDGNGRYFEPAPGRTWLLGAQLGYRF